MIQSPSKSQEVKSVRNEADSWSNYTDWAQFRQTELGGKSLSKSNYKRGQSFSDKMSLSDLIEAK
jgi:hypothetical protein